VQPPTHEDLASQENAVEAPLSTPSPSDDEDMRVRIVYICMDSCQTSLWGCYGDCNEGGNSAHSGCNRECTSDWDACNQMCQDIFGGSSGGL
jgi:hypothetical protein